MGNQASQPKLTAQDKAIFQLKQQRDNLKKYQKKLSVVVEKQQRLAKNAVAQGNTDKAKVYLRSKKQQESIIKSTYDQLQNLENLLGSIEFKLIEKDVLYGLSQGNEVLKKLNTEMSVEKIDKVMDDLEDERMKVDEISEALGGQLSNSEEAEVDAEFLALEQEYLKSSDTAQKSAQNSAQKSAQNSAQKSAQKSAQQISPSKDHSNAVNSNADISRLEELPDISKTSQLPSAPKGEPKANQGELKASKEGNSSKEANAVIG